MNLKDILAYPKRLNFIIVPRYKGFYNNIPDGCIVIKRDGAYKKINGKLIKIGENQK